MTDDDSEVVLDSHVKPPQKKQTPTEKAQALAFMRYRRNYKRIYIAEPSHYEVTEDGLMAVYINGTRQPGMSLKRMNSLVRQMQKREQQ